jgi:hypothetical protein
MTIWMDKTVIWMDKTEENRVSGHGGIINRTLTPVGPGANQGKTIRKSIQLV